MRKLMKNRKGFTLMEVLIVVAIIAILIGIAIPTFTKALNRAKMGVDDANIRSAYAQYRLDVMTDADTGNDNTPADTDKVKAAFTAIGVDKLEYYVKINVPSNGTAWTANDTGAGSGCATSAVETVAVTK